jgi:hypothetical protein
LAHFVAATGPLKRPLGPFGFFWVLSRSSSCVHKPPMAGLGSFDQKGAVAVTMPIATAFKSCRAECFLSRHPLYIKAPSPGGPPLGTPFSILGSRLRSWWGSSLTHTAPALLALGGAAAPPARRCSRAPGAPVFPRSPARCRPPPASSPRPAAQQGIWGSPRSQLNGEEFAFFWQPTGRGVSPHARARVRVHARACVRVMCALACVCRLPT